jgi:hypothetical protein
MVDYGVEGGDDGGATEEASKESLPFERVLNGDRQGPK